MVSAKGSQLGGADRRLQNLGIQLPAAPTPFGSYVETVQTGNLLFFSGMLPVVDHKPKYLGRLGKELDTEAGRDAAYTAALSVLAAAKKHLGIRGPWEWDVKRMAASLVLAGREANNTDKKCKTAAQAFVEAYREAIYQFSTMPVVDLARYQVFRHLNVSPVLKVLRKAERATALHNLEQLGEQRNGKWRFRDNKPLRFHVPPTEARQVIAGLRNYVDSLLPERQHWFSHYSDVDVSFRVVGIGSVGVRDYIVLMFGTAMSDPLFIQIKEEVASAYTQYLPPAAAPINPPINPPMNPPINQGQRVALGQRAMQVQSDIFLGWTSLAGRDYLVRQLRDHKAGIDDEDLEGEGLVQYAQVCGELLAKGHARTGDPYAISGYLGNRDKFDKAIANFGVAYADQTTKDFEEFTRAIRAGKIRAAKLAPPKPQKRGKAKRTA